LKYYLNSIILDACVQNYFRTNGVLDTNVQNKIYSYQENNIKGDF